MRGDEQQQPKAYADEGLPVRRGPRHAAPKKSLLTKLHMPNGKKALALAAMPTAVFVGMGLTPKLAMADGNPDIPFAPGPCVTRSDEPEASESPSPSASPTLSATPTDGPDGGGKPGQDDGATPEPTRTAPATEDPAAGKPDEQKPDTAQKPDAQKPAEEPSPTPTPTKSKNPLDPLGLGDALRDLFNPNKDKDKAEEKPEEKPAPPASPSPSPTAESPKPADKPKSDDKTPEKSQEKPPAKDAAGETADAIREAAEKAGRSVEELPEDAKGLDPKKDEDIPDGAKPRFPCPVPDPEALAAASLEPGIPLLPADPWVLESTLLTLNGLDYKGIVEVKKADGSIKKVLKFTASSIDIKDLHQLTVGPAGTTGHVKSRPGSTSTIRNGTVTMYTEELKGNLFGLIPITFNPQTPPPLNVPFAFFTKVKVVQAGQFGGSLTVPGLENYLEPGRS
ncbi:hypothetical protein [Streptomyces bacillaris]|uniref:hypothetical protein n=1 Tax=Streptomyces bacillaris TaxID=68179 RepID=UPI0036FF09B8